MLIDAQGLDVTTESGVAIAAINRFIDQALGYGNAAEAVILSAIAADPSCAIAHAYAAAHYLSQENRVDGRRALPYLAAAQRYATVATHREQSYIGAIAAWANRDIALALRYHEAIAHRYPHDLISVQQGQYHYFYEGRYYQLLDIAQSVLPANPTAAYLRGMIAFGLEQCHRLSEAEATAHEAIALHRNDPWAHHAIAHVLETQQRVDEGIAWMERFAPTWDGCNSMLYTHNWWHIALYYLAKGDRQTVLDLYDRHIWGRARPDSPKDQVGAIATLLRLELRGMAVGDRWRHLAAYLGDRVHDHALPFQDLHYVYALARANHGDWLSTMLQSMEDHAQSLPAASRQTWLDVAIPAARGLAAHAQGDWASAVGQLKPVAAHLWTLGGSHAQRQMFDQIYLHAAQRLEVSQRSRRVRSLAYCS